MPDCDLNRIPIFILHSLFISETGSKLCIQNLLYIDNHNRDRDIETSVCLSLSLIHTVIHGNIYVCWMSFPVWSSLSLLHTLIISLSLTHTHTLSPPPHTPTPVCNIWEYIRVLSEFSFVKQRSEIWRMSNNHMEYRYIVNILYSSYPFYIETYYIK